MSGENDITKVKSFDPAQFGVDRLFQQREGGVRANVVAVVTTGRMAKFAMQAKSLIQQGSKKGISSVKSELKTRLVISERTISCLRKSRDCWRPRASNRERDFLDQGFTQDRIAELREREENVTDDEGDDEDDGTAGRLGSDDDSDIIMTDA